MVTTGIGFAVRRATREDLDAVARLERAGFKEADRFSRSQLRYLIDRANSSTLVAEDDRGAIIGAAILLWRQGSPAGRLYSIVTHPASQGRGVGGALLDACEREAAERGCARLSLEVRADNARAIGLYERRGYITVQELPGYYEDGGNGLRMEKRLPVTPEQTGAQLGLPFYKQTLEFTCGPACVMMAMKHFDPSLKLDRALELKIWKEATLIFMTDGLGGCGPFGLAAAAQRRGYQARVVSSNQRTPFLSTVRSEDKKDVIRLVHEQLREEAEALGVKADYYTFRFEDIAQAIRDGAVPIVLVSAYRRHGVRAPHWVAVTGFDAENVYVHDPYEGYYEAKDGRNVKVPIAEFRRMRTYGKELQRSVVFIMRPPKPVRGTQGQ